MTVQVQLRVIREGMEGNTVSAHNVHKVGHIYYKQQYAHYLAGSYVKSHYFVTILSLVRLKHYKVACARTSCELDMLKPIC